MKVFEFAGVIFNADNICTVQKVTLMDKEDKEKKNGKVYQMAKIYL